MKVSPPMPAPKNPLTTPEMSAATLSFNTDLRFFSTLLAKYRETSPVLRFLAYARTFTVSIKWKAVLWNISTATYVSALEFLRKMLFNGFVPSSILR